MNYRAIPRINPELEKFWNSEINSLGYPPAALFGFCVALVADIIPAVVIADLSSAHGNNIVDNKLMSIYYLERAAFGTQRLSDWRLKSGCD
ncbi:MAG: hypothetical protein V1844_18440 [Pseudomonadota bacterium]